ncbi:MAG: hypothetical protein F7B78_03425 [Desulfurococcales archaeon]|nr:hypothetical protein [Desulfurococcales archaeon]
MEAQSLPVDLELALEPIEKDLERLMKAAEAFERNGNISAAYEAVTWRLAMGNLYKETAALAEALRDDRMLEASQRACVLVDRLHNMMREAVDDRLLFVTAPSRRILATLLNLASNYCRQG